MISLLEIFAMPLPGLVYLGITEYVRLPPQVSMYLLMFTAGFYIIYASHKVFDAIGPQVLDIIHDKNIERRRNRNMAGVLKNVTSELELSKALNKYTLCEYRASWLTAKINGWDKLRYFCILSDASENPHTHARFNGKVVFEFDHNTVTFNFEHLDTKYVWELVSSPAKMLEEIQNNASLADHFDDTWPALLSAVINRLPFNTVVALS